MASKSKTKAKIGKKSGARGVARPKSLTLKVKTAKAVSRSSRNGSKPSAAKTVRRTSKASAKRSPSIAATGAAVKAAPIERTRSKEFADAIQAYEAAIKLMHAEEFEKAIRKFESLLNGNSDEPEIQERAKVLINACEKKIQERGRTVLRSADDYYNIAIAELNGRQIDSAITHLQHALKLAPKGDHIHYALATANALNGNRDQALHYLKQSIHYRGENRFLAARDSDFETLQDDPDFKQLLTSSEK